MKLDFQEAVKYAREIEEIVGSDKSKLMQDGDDLKLNFEFCCAYLDGIVRKFECIEKLLDDDKVMKNATVECLNQTRSLFVDLVNKITRIQERANAPISDQPGQNLDISA